MSGYDDCARLLGRGTMFQSMRKKDLYLLCEHMTRRYLKKGETFVRQGAPQKSFVVVEEGKIERWRTVEGARHLIDEIGRGTVMGSLHVLTQDPAHADAIAVGEKGATIMEMTGPKLKLLYEQNPTLAIGAIHSLSLGVRALTNHLRTPLLEQTSRVVENPVTGILATSAGALVESYYRAGLNSLINFRLMGTSGMSKSFFPNMHVQIPTRIVYINGIKQVRQHLEPYVYNASDLTRFGLACVPGLLMTPLSSILEASNITHHESIARRWRYGLVPRAVREVIFAIGFNQLSDYLEERVTEDITTTRYRAAIGSLEAGCIAGVLSHHPHNLSTLKLVHSDKSYSELTRLMVNASADRRAARFPPGTPRWLLNALAIALPQGIFLRTLQIAGTFILVNGAVELFSRDRR